MSCGSGRTNCDPPESPQVSRKDFEWCYTMMAIRVYTLSMHLITSQTSIFKKNVSNYSREQKTSHVFKICDGGRFVAILWPLQPRAAAHRGLATRLPGRRRRRRGRGEGKHRARRGRSDSLSPSPSTPLPSPPSAVLPLRCPLPSRLAHLSAASRSLWSSSSAASTPIASR